MDVEVTVFSDKKDGLLREMGVVVIECGFTLHRQRMMSSPNGVELWLKLSGEQGRLLELEDRLSSHPLVNGFEANHLLTDSTQPPRPARPVPSTTAAGRRPAAPTARPRRRPSSAAPAIDIIEPVLPRLAKSYPKIFPQLLDLQDQVHEDQWGPSLKFIGVRVGAWVYKRDYALGGQLDLKSAMRQIALPAMRSLLPTETRDFAIYIKNNPFCLPGTQCRNGDFFCGFLQGLLHEAGASSRVVVREVQCRSEGAQECVFEVAD
ncbi:4-vinyl reductase [Microbulbifer celer]|uniref:4-vinyl reductase 4VR domain-containing protein n=1 Tax=Microbulbifer celer TaxID=435905 RepID=A0ABW3U3M1_9GAMM|nr:4-vinyl reductase [Microbulbifer celer]UFN57898.1 4-vinyl reductase [Microbulbifer celer]